MTAIPEKFNAVEAEENILKINFCKEAMKNSLKKLRKKMEEISKSFKEYQENQEKKRPGNGDRINKENTNGWNL